MSIALIQPSIAATATRKSAQAVKESPESNAPAGYRWVSRRWRVLPDGTRDYAAYHGLTEFRTLLPVSSRLHSSKHA